MHEEADGMNFIKNGGAAIQALIDEACESGVRAVTLTGLYEIEKTILIPSDFTLTLMNCHLRMAPGTFCNMFTNAACRTDKGRLFAGADHNIIIEGCGRAILDGGEYNGLCESNSEKEGRPHISVNSLLLFSNVDGFTVRNLHLRNQRWWACNFVSCRNGYIANIDFLADYSYMLPDGTRHFGLGKRAHGADENICCDYKYVYIKNADGIDIRSGCHDIIIENITGFTEDDTVALTGLAGRVEALYGVTDATRDIYNIIVRNINSAAYCANVRLLNQGGIQLYNILIDGVYDSSKDSPYMERGGSGVRLGDNHLYGSRHATAGETFNITIRNVCSRAGAALRLAGAMSDCLFENIRTFDGASLRIEDCAAVDVSRFIRA